jgi:hypothetical protein
MLGTAYSGIFTLGDEGGTELGRVEITRGTIYFHSVLRNLSSTIFLERKQNTAREYLSSEAEGLGRCSSLRGSFRRLTSRLEPRHAPALPREQGSQFPTWKSRSEVVVYLSSEAEGLGSSLRDQLEPRHASADARVAKNKHHIFPNLDSESRSGGPHNYLNRKAISAIKHQARHIHYIDYSTSAFTLQQIARLTYEIIQRACLDIKLHLLVLIILTGCIIDYLQSTNVFVAATPWAA